MTCDNEPARHDNYKSRGKFSKNFINVSIFARLVSITIFQIGKSLLLSSPRGGEGLGLFSPSLLLRSCLLFWRLAGSRGRGQLLFSVRICDKYLGGGGGKVEAESLYSVL